MLIYFNIYDFLFILTLFSLFVSYERANVEVLVKAYCSKLVNIITIIAENLEIKFINMIPQKNLHEHIQAKMI